MKNYLILIFILFIGETYSQNQCADTPLVTYEGKNYSTVQIGNQCWLKENLNAGNMITVVENSTNNSIIEKYCLDDKLENCIKYGGLYQWNEAMAYSTNSGAKGICPDGWHIPTEADSEQLKKNVNNNSNVLKAVGQGTGSGAGTNSSGFSALLYTHRDNGGYFGYVGYYTNFWVSKEFVLGMATTLEIINNNAELNYSYQFKTHGYSVRCVKDALTSIGEDQEKNETPSRYSLNNNYPNPFNPSTTISYHIPMVYALSEATVHVSLKVFDVFGREVATLVNENQKAGNYSVEFRTQSVDRMLSSGIYIYQLIAGNFMQTKKMMLLK